MFLPRIIPVLLLQGKGLVKTVKFGSPKYIGDPINAVKIFNDLKADELIFLDITASKEKRTIPSTLVQCIGDEAYMPFGVGGGITKVEQIEQILKSGAEKVIINTYAIFNPKFIEEAAKIFGSQSIVVSIDFKKGFFGKNTVWIKDGTQNTKYNPLECAIIAQENGAGELFLNSIDLDGTMNGYNLDMIKSISEVLTIPLIACGGAGNIDDFKKVLQDGGAHAAAAGSLFVYQGNRKAVLINYPNKEQIKEIFNG